MAGGSSMDSESSTIPEKSLECRNGAGAAGRSDPFNDAGREAMHANRSDSPPQQSAEPQDAEMGSPARSRNNSMSESHKNDDTQQSGTPDTVQPYINKDTGKIKDLPFGAKGVYKASVKLAKGDTNVAGTDEDPNGIDLDALLSICADEPIHIPGAIQGHGAMIVLDQSTMRVRIVSDNIGLLIDAESPKELLNLPFESVLTDASAAQWRRTLRGLRTAETGCILTIGLDFKLFSPKETKEQQNVPKTRHFYCTVHQTLRNPNKILIDCEPREPYMGDLVYSTPNQDPNQLFFYMQSLVHRFSAAQTKESLIELAVQAVAEVTSYDRVMMYYFDADWHGIVLAEELREEVVDQCESYLGLHFPASDIPKQARELYLLNKIRVLAHREAKVANFIGAPDEVDLPLDLSYSTLRAISPIHLKYIANMRTMATMSIAIMVSGRLWGLVACHKFQPHLVPYHVRSTCLYISSLLSTSIENLEYSQREKQRRLIISLAAMRKMWEAEAIGFHTNSEGRTVSGYTAETTETQSHASDNPAENAVISQRLMLQNNNNNSNGSSGWSTPYPDSEENMTNVSAQGGSNNNNSNNQKGAASGHRSGSRSVPSVADFEEFLACVVPDLLQWTRADYAIAYYNGKLLTYSCPSDASESIQKYVQYNSEHPHTRVFVSSCLKEDLKGFHPNTQMAGAFHTPISEGGADYITCFGVQQLVSVKWAGGKDKVVTFNPKSDAVEPRNSFAEWKELVSDRSRPWEEPLCIDADLQATLQAIITNALSSWRNHLLRMAHFEAMDRNARLVLEQKMKKEAEWRKNMLLNNVSHELRTPLHTIKAALGLLTEDSKVETEQRELLNEASQANEDLTRLIDHLMKYTDLESSATFSVPSVGTTSDNQTAHGREFRSNSSNTNSMPFGGHEYNGVEGKAHKKPKSEESANSVTTHAPGRGTATTGTGTATGTGGNYSNNGGGDSNGGGPMDGRRRTSKASRLTCFNPSTVLLALAAEMQKQTTSHNNGGSTNEMGGSNGSGIGGGLANSTSSSNLNQSTSSLTGGPGAASAAVVMGTNSRRKVWPTLEVNIDEDGVAGDLKGYEEGWKTVVEGLISNAVKWSPDNGVVRIECRRWRSKNATARDASYQSSGESYYENSGDAMDEDSRALSDDGKMRERWPSPDIVPSNSTARAAMRENWAGRVVVELVVRDSGPGIPADKRHLIFNHFEPIDSSLHRNHRTGLGLGLSLVKKYTETMGGVVFFQSTTEADYDGGVPESQRQTGSVFVCQLPFAEVTDEERHQNESQKLEEWDKDPAFKRMMQLLPKVITERQQQQQEQQQPAQKQRQVSHSDIVSYENQTSSSTQSSTLVNQQQMHSDQQPSQNQAHMQQVQPQNIQPHPQPVNFKAPRSSKRTSEVRLPSKKLSAVNSASNSIRSELMRNRTILGKVLIAEDNLINQNLLKRQLQKMGFSVLTADDGLQAVKVWEQHRTEIDIILMDLAMPNMDGFDATEIILKDIQKNDFKRIPIIAVTAQAFAGNQEICYARGMDGYISKPVDVKLLVQVMEDQYLRYERMRTEQS